jgi:cytochrome c oxidase accessory protein FixG
VRRGSKTREERAPQGLGDCIDCGYCVQVCPTGIDIRNGLQLQCIHCALCVDACDSIMDNIGWPRGLIRYTSDNELAGDKTRLVKPKTIGYALGLSVAIGFLLWGMLSQAKMDAAVSQVRQPLYVVLSDGSIQNSYEIKVNNKTPETVTVDVAIEGLDGAELDLGRIEQLVIEPEKSGRLFAKVRWGENSNPARKQHDLDFEISVQGRDDIAPIRIESHFFTP